MKKALKKQAAFVMLSAALAVQAGFPGYAATSVMGSWANEDGGWKFYGSDHQAYTGWVKTESGWYYLNPADGKMATGWQKIDNFWYYFDTAAEGVEGRMHTGWYKSPENTWYFFENGSGSATEGHMVTGWQWIDGYCYYFSAEASEQPGTQGAMYANKRTPDGYPTNADGQWTQDGQATYRPGLGFSTKSSSSMGTSSSSSSNSNNGSNTTPDTPSTPNQPSTPDQPDKPGENPDTPDEKEEYQYLLMNIPYEEFYAAEIENNAEGVDAVTSATKAKPRTGNLVAGSYHANSDGSNISGVTFPVKIKKGTDLSKFKQITDSDSLTITVTNRGKEVTTDYNGKDALFESADYSYYVLSEVPSYYKEVSVDADGNLSFGKAEGTEQKVDGVSANLSTTSNYGDYQLSFSGMPDLSKDTVYGVVLHTKEGEDYGLRHLENIWLRTQLAWSAGFTTQSHGSPLAFEHYQSMMGKKLTGVTYYTSKGIMGIPFAESVYVPVKIASGLTIENGAVDGGDTGISVSGAKFPADFHAEYQVKNSLGKQVDASYDIESGKLTWEGSLTAGSYTLTVTDKSGKYAPVSGSFVLETEAVPAAFTLTEEGWKVTKAEGVSDEDFRAYLSAITNVKVGEKDYAASGRRAVKIIDTMTGEIDFTAKSNDKEIFEIGKEYVLEITATGYKRNLTGTVTASEKKPMTTAKAGKATVQTEDGKYVYGTYRAKVLVTTDADGKIVSIKDNGTEPGVNSSYWSYATEIFEKMAGKTVDEIDGVDEISGATVSSPAIKKAVKNALKSSEVSDEYQYLLMNIPYEEFYAAEIENNAEGVDAVTSATKAKPRTGNLVAGSYHANSDGSNISGVTFPVKIKKGTDLSKFKQITDSDSLTITVTNRGKEVTTDYNGKDALFESADYSYYVLSEVPSYYKEVSVDADGNLSFGKAEGTEQKVDGVSANLSTTSNYGDYQLSFSGMPDLSKDTVYGVVLHTKEGEDYGLRHLENIWLRTQLAWSAGFTTQSHGSPLAFEHYQSMMGKKLTGVTYYTSKGIMGIPFAESVYVPVKIASGLTIENGAVDGGDTGISVSGAKFPADFHAEYQVKNSLGKQVDASYDIESGKLTWEGSLTAGSYTLTVTDKSGKYAPVSGSFVLETEAVPAAFTLTEEGWKVTKAEGVSDEDFRAYLSAITNVKVGEKDYAASGRRAVKIIDTMTGEIDFTAKSNDKEIFEIGKEYVLEITATGYKRNLTGTVTASEKKPMTTAKAGKATVQTEDGKYVSGTYQAKVLVTTDADGKIVSIKDNGTEPGANSSFWSMAIKIFEKMAGKTVDEIDGVDTITGATVSSNAIKKAVKNALPGEGEEELVEAPEVRAGRGYLVTQTGNSVSLVMKSGENTTVHYTTDGSDPTKDDETPSYNYATIRANNGKAGKVQVKAAAFDENGNRSKIISVWCVFTDEVPEATYKAGTYEGSADGVQAKVTVISSYGSRPIIGEIKLDDDSEKEYADFLQELITEICYMQSTQITPIAGYDADAQQKVLDAVEAALENAVSAEVKVSMNPEKKIYEGYYGTYDFEEAPEVTLSCQVKDAKIYYYVTDSSTTEDPSVDTWTLYDGAFTPEFTNKDGGNVYVQVAVTRDGGENWLDTDKIRISYKEKADENTVMIGDTGYSSLEKALAEVQNGEVIVLNKDISLDGDVKMPAADFRITSADGQSYRVESRNALELNGNLEISHVDWRADTYLNGHDFTAGEEVAQSTWRFSYTKLYASSKKGSVVENPEILISSGQFEIYGCAEEAELTGDVEITVDGTAAVKVIGAESGSKLDGNINVTINGNNGATLDSFIGRESSAEVTGNLELKLEGTVQLSKWGGTYEAIHYNSKDVWGTLDLTEAEMSEDDIKRFSGFETVIGVDDEEAEKKSAEEITEEIPDAAEKKSESDVIDETTEEIKEETVKKDESKKDETADSNEIISSDDTDDSEDASESDDDNDQIKEEEKSEDETVGTDEDTKNGSESADENDAEDAKDDADEEEAEEIQTSDTDADLAEEIVED